MAGIVSEQDVIRAIHEGRALDSLRAEDLMTREVETVIFDTSLEDILATFATRPLQQDIF